jgi:hypothetical protein
VYVCTCPSCWGVEPSWDDDDEDWYGFSDDDYQHAAALAGIYAAVAEEFVTDQWPHLTLAIQVGGECRRHRTASVRVVHDELERLVADLGINDWDATSNPVARYRVVKYGYVPPALY